MRDDIKKLLQSYEAKLEHELSFEREVDYSIEYEKFRKETLASLNSYEKACKSLGNIIKLKLKESDEKKITKALETAHINANPSEVYGFSIFTLISCIFISLLASIAIYLITGNFPFLLFLLFFLSSVFFYYYLNSMPERLEKKWRLKASSQMVPAILYIVVYMRHTSNLEQAVRFASMHLQPPLSLDFKKIFWDVQIAKFATIKDALDNYLETWREHNLEFVEAFHMIEGSLYEPIEERRVAMLEKSLEIMLDGIYEKMLHYSYDVKNPITNIYMLGIVLPTLGLAILPLASTLLQGAIKWYHVAILFNLIVPFVVFYMTNSVLSKRPGGFGEIELLERNPDYKYYKDKTPYAIAAIICVPLLIIGLIPLIFNYTAIPTIFGIGKDFSLASIPGMGNQTAFDFKTTAEGTSGPFGLVALLMSLCVPLSIGLFFAILYRLKTKKLVKTRKETKLLEVEFAGSLFQLGNRLADNIPAETAFGRVASSLRGTPTAGFFTLVNTNIQQLGMSVDEAIFNKRRGAINYYPSDLIRTSMQVLVESVKKGLRVASKALMSISEYLKNIHKVNERLKDLLADITSGMKSNMTFLAPLLVAIVVGLSSMITMILGKLQFMIEMGQISQEQTIAGLGSVSTIISLFNVSKMIPPYWLQIIVGVYLIEIIFILTITLVTIESGEDRLGEKHEISNNLISSIMLYIVAAFIAIIALSVLATVAVGGIIT